MQPPQNPLRTGERDPLGYVFSKEGAMERIHASDVVYEIRKGFSAAALLLAAIPNSVIAAPKKPTSEKTEKKTSIGMLAGDPYLYSVVGETELRPSVAIQLHGGTNLDDFSGGGRLILKHSGTLEPYVGVGAGFETEWDGIHPFGIASVGLRVGDRAKVFVELNEQLREERPYASPPLSTGFAAGLMVELEGGDDSRAQETHPSSQNDPRPSDKKPTQSRRPDSGVSVGIPYTIALAKEWSLNDRLAIEGHAGTAIAISSVGARVIVGKQHGNRLYAFGGTGLWLSLLNGEGTDNDGTDYLREHSPVYPYLWTGVGARGGNRQIELFAEGGLMFTDEDIGSSVLPAIAGGIRL